MDADPIVDTINVDSLYFVVSVLAVIVELVMLLSVHGVCGEGRLEGTWILDVGRARASPKSPIFKRQLRLTRILDG